MRKFFFRSFSVLVEPPARALDSNFSRPASTFDNRSALDLRFRLAAAMIMSGLTAPLTRISSSLSSSSESQSSSLSSSNSRPWAIALFLRAASRGSRRAWCSRSTSFLILEKSEAVKMRVEVMSCFNWFRSSCVILDKSKTGSSCSPSVSCFSLGSINMRSGASSSSSSFTGSSSFMASSISSSSSSVPSASKRSCSRSQAAFFSSYSSNKSAPSTP
mmetsp:Transcript_5034/g.11213  ORF Transcript_5034/g.11213 Transcript_5034/m.11213 type:complete len:217 (+) Transcript_5034:223-873(+)